MMTDLQNERRKIKTQPSLQQNLSNSFFEGTSEMKSSNLFKQSIPIKEYSNKFFRQLKRIQHKTNDNSLNIAAKQKRINALMRKRQMVCRPSSKKQNIGSIQLKELGNSNMQKLTMTINSYGKSNNRIKTQAFNSIPLKQSSDISIIQIENELVLNSSFSKVILPPSTTNLIKEPQSFVENKVKRSSSNLKQVNQRMKVYSTDSKRDKISQSRGLQQYCKMFIKQKSQMVQKMWFDSQKPRQIVSKQIYGDGQNNFQTKKIYPIEKSSKRHTIQTYSIKKPIMRTPMRTIDNNPGIYMKAYDSDMNIYSEEDCFELKGWETKL